MQRTRLTANGEFTAARIVSICGEPARRCPRQYRDAVAMKCNLLRNYIRRAGWDPDRARLELAAADSGLVDVANAAAHITHLLNAFAFMAACRHTVKTGDPGITVREWASAANHTAELLRLDAGKDPREISIAEKRSA